MVLFAALNYKIEMAPTREETASGWRTVLKSVLIIHLIQLTILSQSALLSEMDSR